MAYTEQDDCPCACIDHDSADCANGGPKICCCWAVFDTKLIFCLTRWGINRIAHNKGACRAAWIVFSPLVLTFAFACDILIWTLYFGLWLPMFATYAIFVLLTGFCFCKMKDCGTFWKVGLAFPLNVVLWLLIILSDPSDSGNGAVFGVFAFIRYTQRIRNEKDAWICCDFNEDEAENEVQLGNVTVTSTS